MKKVFVGLFLGFLVVVFASAASYAETCAPFGNAEQGLRGEGMHMMAPMGRFGMGMMERRPEAGHYLWRRLKGLGLDRKQKEAIREIKTAVMKKVIRLKADERIARLELKDLLDKDTVDMKAVEAKLRQIETTKTAVQLSLIRAGEEIKSNLTAEQRRKFRSMRETAGNTTPSMKRMKRGGIRMPPPRFGQTGKDMMPMGPPCCQGQ